MRFNRVLLGLLPSMNKRPVRVNGGVGYIAEVLENTDVEYEVFDMLLDRTYAKLKQAVKRYNPDLLAFNMFTVYFRKNYGLLEQLKVDFPKIPILIGGPHISTMKERVLLDCSAIDFGIVREGENAILELVRGDVEKSIGGLIYRGEQGEVEFNEGRSIVDLDSVAFPKYNKFKLERYVDHAIPLSTSRGCPYNCIFCTVGSVMGKQIRFKNAQNVVDEIEYWVEAGYRDFCIDDDNFTFDSTRVFEICDEIDRRGIKHVEFRPHNGVRADRTSLEMFRRMKEVGFNYIQVAVESGSDKVLKSLRKGESIQQIEQCIKDATEVGMEVQLGFVVGAPSETWSDLMNSIELAGKYEVWRADFLNLIPFPGTELFEWVRNNGHFLEEPEKYLNRDIDYDEPLFETALLSKEERREITRITNRLNKKLRYNAALRKLKRYGYFGGVIAFVFATDLFQKSYGQKRFVRYLSDKVRRRLSKS